MKSRNEPSQSAIKKLLGGKQIVISSWSVLHNTLSRMTDTPWIFRGVHSEAHLPIPSIGRESIFGHYKKRKKSASLKILEGERYAFYQTLDLTIGIGSPLLSTSGYQLAC
jgi:hypothetical protein